MEKTREGKRLVAEYPTIIGTVLKHIACTPNKNFDNDAYDKGVIQPARRIRKIEEDRGGNRPSDDEIKECVSLLLTIFETKMVDMDEREDRIKDLLDRHKLHHLFPDILPLRSPPNA